MRLAYIMALTSFLVLAQDQSAVEEQLTVQYKTEDFHHRGGGEAPTLIYDQAFFERFEPQSVGDILKRLPGVAGLAEAGEFTKPQMRGIGPEYTQILINGRRIPGAANDRTTAVDRIPAHLVKQIEIIRAPGADQDASGIGGTINIVLLEAPRQGYLEATVGVTHFDSDDRQRASGSVTYGDQAGRLSYVLSGSFHRRHNPKTQHTDLFEEDTLTLKDEVNTLNADEVGISGELAWDLPESAHLLVTASAFRSKRTEAEQATFVIDDDLDEWTFDNGSGVQENTGLALTYRRPNAMAGELVLDLSHQWLALDDALDIGVFEEDEALLEERETNHTRDRETRLQFSYSVGRLDRHFLKLGLDLSTRTRHAGARRFQVEDDEVEALDFSGVFGIQEQRLNTYVMDTVNFESGSRLQLGLRLEQTARDLVDAGLSKRETVLFPSLHFVKNVGDRRQWRLSLARTVKRSNFKDLQPFLQRDEPIEGLNRLGNPNLKDEFAYGLDLGFEQRLAEEAGVFGLNGFYRRISDHVDTVQVGDEDFQIQNVGDGEVYGLEFDLGLPLTRLRMPNVSFFANVTLLDSELTDPQTGETRRFNLQPDDVVNLGFLHSFPRAGVSYGVNWLTQGKADEVLLTESVVIDYSDNLEMLLEAGLGKHWSLRLTGRNLTNQARTEQIREFDGPRHVSELITRGDESELAGRSFLLTLRLGLDR